MAESHPAPWQHRPAERSVVASTGTTAFAVHGGAWSEVSPGLPAAAAALLAPPILVSGSPVTASAAGSATEERRLAEQARLRLNMATIPPRARQPRRSARVK